MAKLKRRPAAIQDNDEASNPIPTLRPLELHQCVQNKRVDYLRYTQDTLASSFAWRQTCRNCGNTYYQLDTDLDCHNCLQIPIVSLRNADWFLQSSVMAELSWRQSSDFRIYVYKFQTLLTFISLPDVTTVRTKTNQAGSQLYLLNISTERQGGKAKADRQFELLKLRRSFVFHFFRRTFG